MQELKPVEKQTARASLNLDTDAVLIGFGAETIDNQRKGFQHLLAALQKLPADLSVECLVFGAGTIPDELQNLPKMHHFGYLKSADELKRFYSASDLVVVPSREDNSPQIGLEAMACGTPVVAFDAGGIPEYVLPGQTGLLAELGNEQQLAERIMELVRSPEMRASMSSNCRQLLLDEFEADTQATKYTQLYQQLLNRGGQTKAA